MMVSARLIISLEIILGISTLAQPITRILGGEEASKNSFPYAVSIRLDGAHICGGSIIENRSILTAAHCVLENGKIVSANRFSVRVGSTNQFSGGQLVYVSDISLNPNYDGVKNDIAIITLKSTLQWSDRINKISIATSFTDEPAPDTLVTVAGWGEQLSNVSSYKLHTMNFVIANDEVCSTAYSGNDNSTICLAHDLKRGSCTGDAGNGAVYNKKLIGVSNFVIGACGSRYPEVFSNVAYYATWIKSILI